MVEQKLNSVVNHELMPKDAVFKFNCYSDNIFCYTANSTLNGYFFEICFIPHDNCETVLSRESLKDILKINQYFISIALCDEDDFNNTEEIYRYKQKEFLNLN